MSRNVPFQVVELLNQAALISTDEKLTVLKQVCSLLKSVTEINCFLAIPCLWHGIALQSVRQPYKTMSRWIINFSNFQVQELIINKDPSLLDNFLDVSKPVCNFPYLTEIYISDIYVYI